LDLGWAGKAYLGGGSCIRKGNLLFDETAKRLVTPSEAEKYPARHEVGGKAKRERIVEKKKRAQNAKKRCMEKGGNLDLPSPERVTRKEAEKNSLCG